MNTRNVLLLCVFLAGCATEPATPLSDPPPKRVKIPAPQSPSADLQAVIDSCCPPGERAWTHADCGPDHECWTRGEVICYRDSVQVEELRTVTSESGDVIVHGVLVCKVGSGLQPQMLVATTDSAFAAEEPVQELGRTNLSVLERAGSVDPVPQLEDLRIPFQINLSTLGVPLVRDEEGKARVSLFGLGTSEDGPAFMGLVKFSF